MAIASPTLFICVVSVSSASGNFSNVQPRDLDDAVVDGRLEAARSHRPLVAVALARDEVGQLVQRVPHRELRGDLGDGVARRLARQPWRERETRGFISMTTISPLSGLTPNWMFDPPVSTPTGADDRDGRVAHPLVLLVGQRLHRRR